MLTSHPNFHAYVAEKWIRTIFDYAVTNFTYKLRSMKQHIEWWNKNVFGNIHRKIEKLTYHIKELEKKI